MAVKPERTGPHVIFRHVSGRVFSGHETGGEGSDAYHNALRNDYLHNTSPPKLLMKEETPAK
jgi:hypothetical protein